MAEDKEEKPASTSETEAPLEPSAVDPAEEQKKKRKKIIMIAVPILVVIIAGILFYVFVLSAHKKEADSQKEGDTTKVEEGHNEGQPQELNSYVDIDPITVPLMPAGTKREYLKLDLILRVGSDQESAAVVAKMPIIKDSLIGFLRSLRSTDFNGSSNTIYLKEEISKRVNKVVAPIVIKEVLFQEVAIN